MNNVSLQGLSEVFTSVGSPSEESESTPSSDSQAEVLMVWPVAVCCGDTQEIKIQLGMIDEYHQDPSSSLRVMVIAGGGTDVVSSGRVDGEGIASCRLSHSQMMSHSVSQLSFPSTSQPCSQPTRPLTIFTTASHSDERRSRLTRLASAAFSLAGVSTTILCARQEVASELELLFSRMAATHLALATSPEVDHMQLLDVHGAFTILAGNGSSRGNIKRAFKSPSKGMGQKKLLFSPLHSLSLDLESPSHWSSQGPASPVQEDGRPKLGGHLSHDHPPWKMPPAERRACEQAWMSSFVPLMRELSYLLTCVPSAFGGRKPSLDLDSPLQAQTWDSKEYSRTLAALVAFLEHHKCWATLSSLLLHAEGIQVRISYQGEVLKGECGSLEPQALKRLLSGAAHDDITVQCLADSSNAEQSLDGMGLGMAQSGDACYEDALAMKLEDWAEKWMEKWMEDDDDDDDGARGSAPQPGQIPSSQSDAYGKASKIPPPPHGLASLEILLAFACCTFFVLLAVYRAN